MQRAVSGRVAPEISGAPSELKLCILCISPENRNVGPLGTHPRSVSLLVART